MGKPMATLEPSRETGPFCSKVPPFGYRGMRPIKQTAKRIHVLWLDNQPKGRRR